MSQVIAKYAAVVLMMAILLLQCYSIAPHAGRKPLQPQCRGNHAECGCLPERIAAHGCCCYRYKPSCCAKESGNAEERAGQQGKSSSLPRLSAAPCGDSPKFIAATLDKLEFLCPDALSPNLAGGFPAYSRPLSETAPSRFTEPPTPPPRRSFSA